MAQSVDFGSGHDFTVREFEPCIGICADSSEPRAASDSVSPSLSAPPQLMMSLSHKQFLIFFNIYSFLRDKERHNMSGGGVEREGDTESEAGSRLRAVSTEPDAGLESRNCEIISPQLLV